MESQRVRFALATKQQQQTAKAVGREERQNTSTKKIIADGLNWAISKEKRREGIIKNWKTLQVFI